MNAHPITKAFFAAVAVAVMTPVAVAASTPAPAKTGHNHAITTKATKIRGKAAATFTLADAQKTLRRKTRDMFTRADLPSTFVVKNETGNAVGIFLNGQLAAIVTPFATSSMPFPEASSEVDARYVENGEVFSFGAQDMTFEAGETHTWTLAK